MPASTEPYRAPLSGQTCRRFVFNETGGAERTCAQAMYRFCDRSLCNSDCNSSFLFRNLFPEHYSNCQHVIYPPIPYRAPIHSFCPFPVNIKISVVKDLSFLPVRCPPPSHTYMIYRSIQSERLTGPWNTDTNRSCPRSKLDHLTNLPVPTPTNSAPNP